MSIILLLTLGVMTAPDDEKEFAEHLAVIANPAASGLMRSSALLAISKLKKLDDPRVTKAYEAFLKHSQDGYIPPGEYGNRVAILLLEVCDERVYARGNFLLAAKLLKKDPIGSPTENFLKLAYPIRSKWWHDKEIVSTLTVAVTGGKDPRVGYNPFDSKTSEHVPYKEANRLSGWTDYCYSLARLGDSRLEGWWKRGLADQRAVAELGLLANPPRHPMPQRLCDFCLEFLLLQHGVEPLTVLKEYDQGRVRKAMEVGGGGRPATKVTRIADVYSPAKAANKAAYDAAIKDYEAIAKRYFK